MNGKNDGLLISNVIKATGYSETYLRRLEKLGMFVPARDDLNRRRWTEIQIGQLIERRASINRRRSA